MSNFVSSGVARLLCGLQASTRSSWMNGIRWACNTTGVDSKQKTYDNFGNALATTTGDFQHGFASALWGRVAMMASQCRSSGRALDLGCKTGVSSTALAQLGLNVIGLDEKSRLPAGDETDGIRRHPQVQLLPFENAEQQLDGERVDVVFSGGMDRSDVPRWLPIAHKILSEDGYLLVAWNDRDLSNPFINALENILEGAGCDAHAIPQLHHGSPWRAADGGIHGAWGIESSPMLGHAVHARATAAANISHVPLAKATAAVAARGVASRSQAHGVPSSIQDSSSHGSVSLGCDYNRHDHQHDYSAVRAQLEGVQSSQGRSLFRVVAFSVMNNPVPVKPATADAVVDMILRQSNLGGGVDDPATHGLREALRLPVQVQIDRAQEMARRRVTSALSEECGLYDGFPGVPSAGKQARFELGSSESAAFVMPMETKLFVLRKSS